MKGWEIPSGADVLTHPPIALRRDSEICQARREKSVRRSENPEKGYYEKQVAVTGLEGQIRNTAQLGTENSVSRKLHTQLDCL